MKEKIEEILRIIKQGDVDAFDAALHKYNIDINYNFFNDIGEMRHDEIVVDIADDSEFGPLYRDLGGFTQHSFLFVAMFYKKTNIVRYLIKNGFVPQESSTSFSALEMAVYYDNVAIFKLVWKTYYPNTDIKSIYYDVCETDSVNIYKYLVEHKHIDITKYDYWMDAVVFNDIYYRYDKIKIVKYLVKTGHVINSDNLRKMITYSLDNEWKVSNPVLFKWLVKNHCKTKKDFSFAFLLFFNKSSPRHFRHQFLWLLKTCKKHGVNTFRILYKHLSSLLKNASDNNPNLFRWLVENCCKTKTDFTNALSIGFSSNFSPDIKLWLLKKCYEHGVNLNKPAKGYEPILFDFLSKKFTYTFYLNSDRAEFIQNQNLNTDTYNIINFLLNNGYDFNNTRDSLGRNIHEYISRNMSDERFDTNDDTGYDFPGVSNLPFYLNANFFINLVFDMNNKPTDYKERPIAEIPHNYDYVEPPEPPIEE